MHIGWVKFCELPTYEISTHVELHVRTDSSVFALTKVCLLLQADLVVDTIVGFITGYDLQSLKEFWKYLDERVFSRLESQYHSSTKRLYFSVLKYYVVHASSNHK